MDSQKRRTFLRGGFATSLALGAAGCISTFPTGSSDDSASSNGDDENATDEERNGEDSDDDEDEPSGTPAGEDVGETLEDFENLEQWQRVDSNGKFEASDDASMGSQALRLRVGKAEPYAGVTRTYDDPLDLTETNLSIALKADTPELYQQLEIRLLAPDEDNWLRLNRTHLGPTDHWMRVDIGAMDEAGTPDLREVTELQLLGHTRDKDVVTEYVVDDLRTVDAPEQGLVVLTFDDNHESQYRAFEMMEEYGFPGVEGVIHGAVGDDDRLDLDQLREMQDAGWDIVSHPHPPGQWGLPLSKFDESEQREILEDSIDWLDEHGFENGAAHYIAPNHTRGATNLELLREYYDSSSSFAGGNLGVPMSDPHTIGRIEGYDLDTVKRHIDLAATYKQVCSPLWHVVGKQYEDVEMSEDEFAAVLEHVDDADVDVVTQSDLVDGTF